MRELKGKAIIKGPLDTSEELYEVLQTASFIVTTRACSLTASPSGNNTAQISGCV